MSPEYVRPYVKAQKNDNRDAEAIAASGAALGGGRRRGQPARAAPARRPARSVAYARRTHQGAGRRVCRDGAQRPGCPPAGDHPRRRRDERNRAGRCDWRRTHVRPRPRSLSLARSGAPSGDDRRQAEAARDHQTRQQISPQADHPGRQGGIAVAGQDSDPARRLAPRSARTGPRHNTVVVALASKLIRIAWALLRDGTRFAASAATAA